jgi:hypothetical protein
MVSSRDERLLLNERTSTRAANQYGRLSGKNHDLVEKVLDELFFERS